MFDPDSNIGKLQELRLTAQGAEALLEAIGEALAVSGGDLDSLSLRRAEPGSEAVVRLAGVSDAAAERLADRLLRRRGVLEVRLVHHWVRP